MFSSTELESCLTNVLEHMEIAAPAPSTSQVSRHSRSAVGVVGLSSTQKTYEAEAGQAAQLTGRITPEIRTTLSKIRLDPQHPSRTLMFFLDEWISLGKEIGDLETEKNRIAPGPHNQAALLAARNKWIRTVNLFVALAEAAEIDPTTHQLLFGPLLAAELKSNKRAPKPPPPPTEAP